MVRNVWVGAPISFIILNAGISIIFNSQKLYLSHLQLLPLLPYSDDINDLLLIPFSSIPSNISGGGLFHHRFLNQLQVLEIRLLKSRITCTLRKEFQIVSKSKWSLIFQTYASRGSIGSFSSSQDWLLCFSTGESFWFNLGVILMIQSATKVNPCISFLKDRETKMNYHIMLINLNCIFHCQTC